MSVRTRPLGNKVIKDSLKFKLSKGEQDMYARMYEDYNEVHDSICEIENKILGTTGNKKKHHMVREIF